jgi:DNA-binding cell septation regulator SpoVG
MISVEIASLRKVFGNGKLLAFADVKFGDAITVKGFTVLEGKHGKFVTPPRKTGTDGRWYDVLLIQDVNVLKEIESKVMEAFDKEKEDSNG